MTDLFQRSEPTKKDEFSERKHEVAPITLTTVSVYVSVSPPESAAVGKYASVR